MTQQKHSPTPWKHVGEGLVTAPKIERDIADFAAGYASFAQPEIDAAHAVKCVNAHDDLVAALTWAMSQIGRPTRIKGQNDKHCDGYEHAASLLAKVRP